MKKAILFLIIFPTLVFSQTRHTGNGESYIKNFRIDGTNYVMDLKRESHDEIFLRLVESKAKYEIEIFTFSPRTENYSVIYSLCYYKKVLFLINIDYKTNNDIGTAEIQKMISTIKSRLGQCTSRTSDNQLVWQYGNYFAQMNETGTTNKSLYLMNAVTGKKWMSVVPSMYALKNNL